MAEEHHHHEESLMEKIADKIHGHDDSSSSDSDGEASSIKAKIFRIFGREKPVHKVLGGGKLADIFLWKNKKVSGGVLGGATAIYVLFELLEYSLLTLVCHSLILALAVSFLWSNVATFIHKSSPHIPDVHLPKDTILEIASNLTQEINQGLATLRAIASGRDLKKFLYVIAGLWGLTIVGNCCNFLTLFYIAIVSLFTIPIVYDKYEDKIDPLAEKATLEFKKHYAVFDAKVLIEVKKQYAILEAKVWKKAKKA